MMIMMMMMTMIMMVMMMKMVSGNEGCLGWLEASTKVGHGASPRPQPISLVLW